MKKKIIAIAMTAMMAFSFTGCADGSVSSGKTDKENNNAEEFVDSGKLELIKQEGAFTQEQLLSRIKAERLIENGGYRDSDEITAIVTLPSNSLVETFNEGAYESYNSVAQYASSSAGRVEAQAIAKKQNSLISELKSKGLIYSVEHNYKTVANAIAVNMPYGNMDAVKAVAGVESVVLCDTYNRPQSVSVEDVNSIVNNVDVYEDTGIFNSGAIDKDGDGKGDYDGNGTAVAILDSGFDCSHTVFQNSNVTKPVFTEANLAQVIDKTNAAETTPGLAVSDVYYSKKIPYMYDYADKDSDVFPYDSEHGTHVAGIIGGNDSVITGIAINTQLVLMKVFPDLQEGANTDDILAALEDATLLQVDAINMSLGSSCGFAREVDEIWVNEVYDSIKESGISLITAASNSYSSGFGGEQGNTSKVSNPDSGTVGSPSTYDAALSVASISGVKSKYLVGNDEHVLFFNESNNVAGKPNDFVKELFAQQGITDNEAHTFEYITVPGVGLATSYTSIRDQVAGKIALIRRGSNTFEEKAQIAKAYGAIACIIYNNIEGDILMSMGKSDHIPTISISKDDGVRLAEHGTGTLKLGFKQEAGPFMSDFSSWGPTPSLGIKPEITAHGGTIKSSVPGGGYEELSGTSMASPNLCGIVVLIRQYLKDKYPEMSAQEYSKLCNQLLMSSSTIIKNQEGNPYSPRKQGAGLASLYNAVTTKAIIEVDGQDRPKLELGDDKGKTGVYTLEFSVRNLSNDTLNYTVALDGMTESVSTSDDDFVAEKAYMLNGNTKVSLVSGDARLKGNTLTVNGGATAKIKIVYSLSNADKNYIISSFPYGMYVEGFVKLIADNNTEINLNAPFLAFFGDWTEAPLFDKTYYEVQSEAHDLSIDEEDKLKADYFATTPYGSYFYNYIIPLGTYLYDIDLSKFDAIPASEEHIALSDYRGAIDGISAVYAGLLRNAKEMVFTITDKVSGEVIYKHTDYNANKAYSLGGGPVPYFEYLRINSHSLGLVNNRQYEFKMQGKVDYGDDGGLSTNVRNTFSFDFYLDNEAPIIKDASYEKTYDRNLKKDRYYITLTIYDNQHVMSVSPIAFTSNSSYTFLTDEPIPVYSERGQDNKVRFEITEYMDALYSQSLIGSAMCFSVDDYALNTNFYICQLPGTRGDFKFTSNGQASGRPLSLITANVGDVVDLTEYLYSTDSTLDANKDYLKYLSWTTSNASIVKADPVTGEFKNGEAICLKAGRAQVTVMEYMDGKQATITINVKDNDESTASATRQGVKKGVKSQSDPIESVNFTYFETKFAYSRAAQTSEIGATGSKNYISSVGGSVAFYPGESIKLHYDVKPWYVENNYTYTYSTSNASIVKVEQDGTVTALKEGTAIITLTVGGSNLRATIIVSVKSEFVIEDRILVAYKGLGGKVVIPDDEGILYIGSFAFCLYDTDNEIELPEDDYDANKIPQTNTSVTEVVIPEGVEEVQKYAFYNCSNLKSVQLPSTIKFVREYSFYGDEKLESINLGDVEVIGAHAFHGCKVLNEVDLSECYSIGASGFEGCSALTSVDLSHLRNAGTEKVGANLVGRTFKDCTSLETVLFDLNGNTKLCREMFVNTAVKEVDIYEKNVIPTYLFAKNSKLESVRIHNSVLSVEFGAFCDCPLLSEVEFAGSVGILGEQAFCNAPELKELTLPDCTVEIGASCFAKSGLEALAFQANTLISKLGGMAFANTALTTFDVKDSTVYNVAEEGALLVSKDGKTVILAAPGKQFGEVTIAENYSHIAAGAFAATDVTKVTFENDSIIIGDYAFSGCENLQSVVFSGNLTQNAVVGTRAFNACASLTDIVNIDKLKTVGDYAFAATGLTEITLGEGATFGEGAFLLSKLTKVTVGKNSVFGAAAFERCSSLEKVIMPEDGGVHFGLGCFYSAISLTEIDLSKTDGIIESQTFNGCTALYEISLKGVEEIGNLAFADCGSLSSITNTNGVKVIGEGAFARNKESGSAPKFATMNLSSLQELGDGAFMGNSGLSEIELPEGLTAVPEYAFALCTNLVSVKLPSTVTEIGTYAFRSCENLVSINLGNVKFIGENAFYNAMTAALVEIDLSSLEKVSKGAFSNSAISGDVTADNLVEIGDNAFSKVYLESFAAPKVKSIGVAAFYKTALMTEFVFGTDLEYIGSYAFLGCTALKTFAFMDGGVKKYEGDMNSYATLSDGALYTKLASGKTELKSVPASLDKTMLTVMEGTVRIDTYAGNANKNITKIVLPDSLRYVGNYAFNKYYNLETVEFNSFSAPVLETEYFLLTDGTNIVEPDFFPEATLAETAPGYGILHNQFDIGGWEMCYFTFKGLVGANNPITMVLPANVGSGYGGVIYEVYFGKAEYAERSEYVAMDEYTSAFVDYAKQIADLKEVLLSDEKLINNAVTMLNSMTQDLTAYGYTQAQADEMIKTVRDAKAKLTELQISAGGKDFKNLLAKLQSLPAKYKPSLDTQLQEISELFTALRSEDQMLIRETKEYANYQKLVQQSENHEGSPVGMKVGIGVGSAVGVLAIAAVAVVAVLMVKKRKGAKNADSNGGVNNEDI